jgi:hypothetical protein
MPLVCATVGLEAAGGLAFAGAFGFGFAAGRAATGRAAGICVGAGSLGAGGAFVSLAGTGGPCRCGLAGGLGLGFERPPGRFVRLSEGFDAVGRAGALRLPLPDLCPP